MQKIDAEGAAQQQEGQKTMQSEAERERAELLRAEQTEELKHVNKVQGSMKQFTRCELIQ